MTTQRISAQAACAAPTTTVATATLHAARAGEIYGRLHAAARRGAPPALVGGALAEYWRYVAGSTPDDRGDILRRLLEDVAAGQATPRGFLPIALGEPVLGLAREATRAYVGGWPASVERREHAIADVLDWIARSLALNRAALCCALLDTADVALLERLAAVRRRLWPDEAAAVFAAFGDERRGEVVAFLEEWRALDA